MSLGSLSRCWIVYMSDIFTDRSRGHRPDNGGSSQCHEVLDIEENRVLRDRRKGNRRE